MIHRTPMGRLGDRKELVGALRFLLIRKCLATSQAVIAVDGGFLSCRVSGSLWKGGT